MRKIDQKISIFTAFLDLFLLNISVFILLFIKYGLFFRKQYFILLLAYNLIWIFLIVTLHPYKLYWRQKQYNRIKNYAVQCVLFIGIISIILIGFKLLTFSRTVIYGSVILFILLRFISEIFIQKILEIYRSKGKNIKYALVIGAGRAGQKLFKFIKDSPEIGIRIIGFLDDKIDNSFKLNHVIGKTNDLKNILSTRRVDIIYIALPFFMEEKIEKILNTSDYFGIRAYLIPDFYKLLKRKSSFQQFDDLQLINIREVPLDDIFNYSLKTILDFFLSLFIITILLPVIGIIGICIKLESKGPVFYTPVRIGLNKKKFKLYKFRTMYENEDEVYGTK